MGDPTGTRRGTNLPRMGDFNQSVVFDAIRRSSDGCSRVELVAATGLSAQTISNVVRRLLGTWNHVPSKQSTKLSHETVISKKQLSAPCCGAWNKKVISAR